MEVRICTQCGKKFNARGKQKLCGGACRLQKQVEYRKKYTEENREKIRLYNKKYKMKFG